MSMPLWLVAAATLGADTVDILSKVTDGDVCRVTVEARFDGPGDVEVEVYAHPTKRGEPASGRMTLPATGAAERGEFEFDRPCKRFRRFEATGRMIRAADEPSSGTAPRPRIDLTGQLDWNVIRITAFVGCLCLVLLWYLYIWVAMLAGFTRRGLGSCAACKEPVPEALLRCPECSALTAPQGRRVMRVVWWMIVGVPAIYAGLAVVVAFAGVAGS